MKNAVLFTLAVLAALQVAHVSGECVIGAGQACVGSISTDGPTPNIASFDGSCKNWYPRNGYYISLVLQIAGSN